MQLLEIGLWNAALATSLALLVAIVAAVYARPPLVYCLWLLVLLKLVTPPLFHVPFALSTETRASEPVSNLQTPEEGLAADEGLVDFDVLEHHSHPRSQAETHLSVELSPQPAHEPSIRHRVLDSAANMQSVVPALAIRSWPRFLGLVWCVGTFVYVVVALERIAAFQQQLKRMQQAPKELCDAAIALATKLDLRRRPQIRVTYGNVSSMAWCALPWVAPVVVFPRKLLAELPANQQVALLAYEMAHLRRRDHWTRWFELIVTALFW